MIILEVLVLRTPCRFSSTPFIEEVGVNGDVGRVGFCFVGNLGGDVPCKYELLTPLAMFSNL